ncbi:MAG: hypothetical protein EPN47_12755 [Acidobacteria bacterium]|nr:MAG: hypothetical protein EPN47_12755 [Acidobacteriota bacterium]
MSNRWVFLAAFLTATFMVAGAFTLSPFFYFELAKSSIFIAIAVMVFFGENRYSYMLGTIFTPIWFLVDLLIGGFIVDFSVFMRYLGGQSISAMSTPLDGIARLAAIFLFAVSLSAWRREVNERFWGKTFWTCLIISVVYVGILAVWYVKLFPAGH